MGEDGRRDRLEARWLLLYRVITNGVFFANSRGGLALFICSQVFALTILNVFLGGVYNYYSTCRTYQYQISQVRLHRCAWGSKSKRYGKFEPPRLLDTFRARARTAEIRSNQYWAIRLRRLRRKKQDFSFLLKKILFQDLTWQFAPGAPGTWLH